jgi:hypothetical protein
MYKIYIIYNPGKWMSYARQYIFYSESRQWVISWDWPVKSFQVRTWETVVLNAKVPEELFWKETAIYLRKAYIYIYIIYEEVGIASVV